jgi:hypothetical protein
MGEIEAEVLVGKREDIGRKDLGEDSLPKCQVLVMHYMLMPILDKMMKIVFIFERWSIILDSNRKVPSIQ